MLIKEHYMMRPKGHSKSSKEILLREMLVQASVSIKLEPAFLAEHEGAFLAAGYIKQSRGERSGRGGNSLFLWIMTVERFVFQNLIHV